MGGVHFSDSKVHLANMVPNWGRQNPGGHHVGHMNLAILVVNFCYAYVQGIIVDAQDGNQNEE